MGKIDTIKSYLKEGVDEKEVETALDQLFTVDENFLEEQYKSNNKSIRPWVDKKVGSGIEGFKTNTMAALVEQQVSDRIKKQKDETAAETQFRLINEKLDKVESERKREQHINKALEYANGKIPSKYVHKLLGNDADETISNIDEFIKDFNISVNEEVDERFKEHGRTVSYKQNTQPEKTSFTKEEVAKMPKEEFKKNFNKIFKK